MTVKKSGRRSRSERSVTTLSGSGVVDIAHDLPSFGWLMFFSKKRFHSIKVAFEKIFSTLESLKFAILLS